MLANSLAREHLKPKCAKGPAAAQRQPRRDRGLTVLKLLVGVSIILTIAAISIATFRRAWVRANEASAVASLRLIHTAEQRYFDTYGGRFSDTLRELGPPVGAKPSADAADLIPPDLASGQKSAYRFVYKPAASIPIGLSKGKGKAGGKGEEKGKGGRKKKAFLYSLTAEPMRVGVTGLNYYYVDETGVIRFAAGVQATGTSPPI